MTFPLIPHPTWDQRDSTKLTDYKSCARKYFYEYILGWKVDRPAQDLHFGAAWHIAREHQLLHGYGEINTAFNLFLAHYRDEYPEDTDSIYLPKTPPAVLAGLLAYYQQQSHDLLDYQVAEVDGKKMTEISGTVPVDEKRVLHYKIDAVMVNLHDMTLEAWDHKTTTEKWFQDTRWDNEFYLSIQNGTYTHCLYCLFPIAQVKGVKFCKTGFGYLSRGSANRSQGHHVGIRYVEAFKNIEQMNIWLWNTLDIMDDIDRDMDRLHHCKEEDPVMMAFQQNPNSCTSYRGCPYHDFCMTWSNPLQRCHTPEIGFKVEFWDPSAMDTRNKMDLKRII